MCSPSFANSCSCRIRRQDDISRSPTVSVSLLSVPVHRLEPLRPPQKNLLLPFPSGIGVRVQITRRSRRCKNGIAVVVLNSGSPTHETSKSHSASSICRGLLFLRCL